MNLARRFLNAIGGSQDGYTEQQVAEAEARAEGTYGDRSAAIFEAIASSHERAFSQGRLTGGSEGMRAAVHPALLAWVGRSLVERGEFLADVARLGGRWLIRPAVAWEIVAGQTSDDPEAWRYRLTAATPGGAQIVRERPHSMVIHVVTRASPNAPYCGRGLWPLTRNTGDAVGASEARLKEELSAKTGQLLDWPGAGGSDAKKDVKAKLKTLRGGVAIPTLPQSLNRAGRQQVSALRIGANPPEQLGVLRGQSAELLALAAGIPGSMVRGGRGSEQRESLRVLLFMTILPLAGLVSAELSRVFEADVQLEFSRLTAADLGGRARAAKQLTDAGVDLERALSLAGFSE